MNRVELINRLENADMVLVGLGEEFEIDENNREKYDSITKAYANLAEMLDKRNYFIMSSCKDTLIYKSSLDVERIVEPLAPVNDYQSEDDYDHRWQTYSKWLGGTLNKNICILELGVLLSNPNVIRWPFEKIAFLNAKSSFIRINGTIPQLSKEIADKGISVKENSIEFLLN